MSFNCWGSMARQSPSPTRCQSCFPDTIRTQCISQMCETPYLGRRFDSVFQLRQSFTHLLLPTVLLCWRSTSNALRLQATDRERWLHVLLRVPGGCVIKTFNFLPAPLQTQLCLRRRGITIACRQQQDKNSLQEKSDLNIIDMRLSVLSQATKHARLCAQSTFLTWAYNPLTL